MSMIEGIGDEVVQFFSAVIIIGLALIAWWSTNITEGPLIRTVLILERRTRNRNNNETLTPQTSTSDNENGIDTGQDEVTEEAVEPEPSESASKNENAVVNASVEVAETVASQSTSALPDIDPEVTQSSPPIEERGTPETLVEETTEIVDQIRIRLKYLNEDQKLVDGRLQEPLGDFKRRHFGLELDADKLVRLIFNGQVLQSDNQTLQGYGLYDNCVVHCLVHTPRAGTTPSVRNNSASQPTGNPPPDWNLSTLLYTCLSVALAMAWYCRYQYAQLFTISTTVALIALTCIFSVSVFSLNLPDQEGIPQ